MLLRRREDDYTTSYPVAADVLLLIEVADTSLTYDRDTKGPTYAAAGIADYWILDLPGKRLLIYREPVDGSYRSEQTLTREDTIRPLAFLDLEIAVSAILS